LSGRVRDADHHGGEGSRRPSEHAASVEANGRQGDVERPHEARQVRGRRIGVLLLDLDGPEAQYETRDFAGGRRW